MSLDESLEDPDDLFPVLPRQLSRSPAPPQIRLSTSPARVAPAQPNGSTLGESSPFKQPVKAALRHNDSQIEFEPIESSPVPENQDSQLLTDRQKEVADRQRHEAASMFPDIRSSPIYKRLEGRDTDILRRTDAATIESVNHFDVPRSPEDRENTPILGIPGDPLGDELPKSSSPIRSSPIAAALSRRSTPKKLDTPVQLQEKDDEVPSSPPQQSVEEDEETTQEFDTQAYLAPGMADEKQAAAAQSSEKTDQCHVQVTISPSRLAETNSSHEDWLNQARQRFEDASSFPTGTDIITGTDERDGEAQELPYANPSHDANEDPEVNHLLVTDPENTRSSSPAPSSSGLLADAQLRAELEASTQRSSDKEPLGNSVISDSFSAVVPATRDEAPEFTTLDNAQLDRIVRVFFENPEATLSKIRASSTGPVEYVKSGKSRKYRERTAKEAWENMSAEQKPKALLPPTAMKLKSKNTKQDVEQSSPAKQATLAEPVIFSSIPDDSPASSQSDEAMHSQNLSRRGRKALAIPNLKRRKSSRLSQVSEASDSSQTPADIATESDAEPARKKRRRMSPAASQGSSKSETEVVPATAPESPKKRKRSSPVQEESIQDSVVVPATNSQPAKKPKLAEESETIRRFSARNRGSVSRGSDVQVTPGSLGQYITPRQPQNNSQNNSQTTADVKPEEYPDDVTTVSVPAHTIMIPPMSERGASQVRGHPEDNAISVSSEQSDKADASASASPKKFFERFGSFGDYCKKMFDEGKSMFGSMSKEECENVVDRLEEVEEELRSAIKEARKAVKSKSG